MKSKVILLSVLLFCSKIVDSIPHSEDQVGQRVNPISNWQVQHAPNAQNPDTDFTQTQNVNIRQEKVHDLYSNQGRYNYDRSPASSLPGEELLVTYDSLANGRRLNSYPTRAELYPSHTSQVEFANQQYRTQNWLPQNKYTISAPNAVLISKDERPLVTTVQEPYPVQYQQPKYAPSLNRLFYKSGRSYHPELFQYPVTGSNYVVNSALHTGSSAPIPTENYSEDQEIASKIEARQSEIVYNKAPATENLSDQSENIIYAKKYRSHSDLSNTAQKTNYDDVSPLIPGADIYSSDSEPSKNPVHYESYREDQAAASVVKAKPIGGWRFPPGFSPQSKIIHSEAVVPTATLIDRLGNIEYFENDKSSSHLSNTAPIKNRDDRSPLIFEADHDNADSIPSKLAHASSKKEAPVGYDDHSSHGKNLSEKPLTSRYTSHSGWNKIARDDSSNGAPVVTETVEVKSRKYETNYESDYRPTEFVPINTYSEDSSAHTESELLNSGNKNNDESSVAHHGSGSLTPLNTNSEQNLYQKLTAGITEFNLKSLVAKPEIKNILAGTKKRYVVIHTNGTVEHLDKLDLDSHQNSKLRLVQTKRKNIDHSDSNEVLIQHSPENIPNNIAKTPVPVDSLPTNNQPADDKKPTPLYVDHANLADEYNSDLSPPSKDLPADHSNLKPSYVILPADDDNSTPLAPNKDQSPQNDKLKPLPLDVTQPGDDDKSELLTSKEDQPADDGYLKLDQPKDENNFTSSSPNARQPAPVKKPEYSYKKHPANDNNSKPLPTKENQPDVDRPFQTYWRHPAHHDRSKHSQVKQSADSNNSNSTSPGENQLANYNNSRLFTSNNHQSGDETDSESLLPHKKQPANHYKSKQLDINQPEDVKNSNSSSPDENQPLDGNNSTPLASTETYTGDDNNSNQETIPDENQPTDESQLKYDNDLKPLDASNKRHPADHNKSKPQQSHVNQPKDYNNSKSSLPDEDQPENGNNFEALPSNENQPADGDHMKPLSSNKEQPGNDNKSKPLPVHATQPENDTKSKLSRGDTAEDIIDLNPSSIDENQLEEDKESKPLPPNENQLTDDLNSEPNPAVGSKNYEQYNSTTVSPPVSNYTTPSNKPQVIKPNKRESATNAPVVSTKICPDDTSEDQIITLSPIEQATDNVSDVPPVATTTTTTRPVETSGKSDIINDTNTNQDDVQVDTTQTYSTTTVSPSGSPSPIDNINDDKTIGTIENRNTQTNDKTIVDQVNGKKDTQTAVYNSSEFFGTNTDVPAESDDLSSVTASPSVQNDVNTGDASGDNSLELENSETDVTITVSSSTPNDSEDEIIAINIEVLESTDDADSSINDKSLVVSIDTNVDSDDDSKTPKPEDCEKDHKNDDDRGKNVEIDISNLKQEPTMWIRTNNQDLIDQLTAKNDTEFDVIYSFHIDYQPVIEREKATTLYCNGTVVIETKEITYDHKDDPTPTIVKTTKIMQIEDYEAE